MPSLARACSLIMSCDGNGGSAVDRDRTTSGRVGRAGADFLREHCPPNQQKGPATTRHRQTNDEGIKAGEVGRRPIRTVTRVFPCPDAAKQSTFPAPLVGVIQSNGVFGKECCPPPPRRRPAIGAFARQHPALRGGRAARH